MEVQVLSSAVLLKLLSHRYFCSKNPPIWEWRVRQTHAALSRLLQHFYPLTAPLKEFRLSSFFKERDQRSVSEKRDKIKSYEPTSDWVHLNMNPSPAVINSLISVPQWVTKKELAVIHRVCVRTINTWMAQGLIPYRKLPSGKISFNPLAVEKALSQFDREAIG